MMTRKTDEIFPLAMYKDTMTVHRKDSDCRKTYEADGDAKGYAINSLKKDGYEICDCVEK